MNAAERYVVRQSRSKVNGGWIVFDRRLRRTVSTRPMPHWVEAKRAAARLAARAAARESAA